MSSRLMVVSVAVLALPLVGLCGPAPAAKGAFELADGFEYSTDAARKKWRPMEGSRGVSVVELAGRRALKLPVNFKGTRFERASWDRDIALDLTMRKGLRMMFHCRDSSPVSHFSLYFHSGDGWYAGSFFPGGSSGWTTVTVEKNATRIEDRPAGWGKIDKIRLSAWRSRNVDTEFHIAELGAFGGGGRIVIVRGDSGATGSANDARAIEQYARVMADFLDGAGIAHAVLGDRDVTADRLKGIRLVILPFNPALPKDVGDLLIKFLNGGGKLLACYTLDGRFRRRAGIEIRRHVSQRRKGHFDSIRASREPLAGAPAEARQASWNVQEAAPVAGRGRVAAWWFDDAGKSTGLPAIIAGDDCVFLTHVLMADDPPAKGQLLLAMVGHLLPEVWPTAAAGHVERVGRFEPYDGFAAARRGIRAQAVGNGAALAAADRADKLRKQAEDLSAGGKFPEAIATAGRAQRALVEAHCLAQKSAPGERRAIWCHSAFGIKGKTWDQAAKALADNGFTAVLPNMLWGGVAFYESDVLPVAEAVRERGDQVALCAAACRKHGIACHVWKVNYNMGWATPKDFARRMKAEGRTQVAFDGSPLARWLCPSHPANRKLEIDAMVEVARKYDVDGIHFDYIRYPGRQGCYCKGCRQRFEKALGRKVANWPADLRKGGEVGERWLEFRREQITAVVAAVAESARKARPGVKISAAVFRDWPADRDSVGQDWKLWCDRGYLDFVCPMDYTPHNGQFRTMVARQLPWTGKVPCLPGIGLSTWPDPTDVAKVIAQIRIARKLGTKGFTIFNYDAAVARDVLGLLGKGITRKD